MMLSAPLLNPQLLAREAEYTREESRPVTDTTPKETFGEVIDRLRNKRVSKARGVRA